MTGDHRWNLAFKSLWLWDASLLLDTTQPMVTLGSDKGRPTSVSTCSPQCSHWSSHGHLTRQKAEQCQGVRVLHLPEGWAGLLSWGHVFCSCQRQPNPSSSWQGASFKFSRERSQQCLLLFNIPPGTMPHELSHAGMVSGLNKCSPKFMSIQNPWMWPYLEIGSWWMSSSSSENISHEDGP